MDNCNRFQVTGHFLLSSDGRKAPTLIPSYLLFSSEKDAEVPGTFQRGSPYLEQTFFA